MLPVAGYAVLLTACGSPPLPLPTAPPRPVGGSTGASGTPSAGPAVPSYPPGGLPGAGALPGTVPAGVPTYPTYPAPTVTVRPPTVPTTRPTPTRSTPPPAPRCTGGPTAQQVLALIKDRPGIPQATLIVTEGPYCAGSWQFAIVGIGGQSDDDVDPLLVVSTGQPSALRLLEAGADVCTDHVERDAPPGIRVRACGS